MTAATTAGRLPARLLALGVLSALLVMGMGAGEARAGLEVYECSFIDGMSAVRLEFGDVDLSGIDLEDDITATFDIDVDAVDESLVVYADAFVDASLISDSQLELELFLEFDCSNLNEVDVESAMATLPADGVSFTVTVATGEGDDLVCSGLASPVWAALYSSPSSEKGYYWTSDGFEAFSTGDVDERTGELFAAQSAAAALADPIDCTTSAPTAAAVSALALVCEPGTVTPGALVTCTVTGGDVNASILWRASASSAFAGQGVTLDANGSGTFSFRVPTSVTSSEVLVELVEWDRSAVVMVTGSALPTRIPAGEGVPAGRVALLGFGILGIAALIGRRSVLAN